VKFRARAILIATSVAAVAAAFCFFDAGKWLRPVLTRVEDMGPWAALWFAVIYVTATLLLVPGSALTLGAGALFGLVRGSILVSLAATLAAAAAFLIGKRVARDWVARTMESRPGFRSLVQAVTDEGWKLVLLTRLSPVFPYTLLNYAFGLTPVKFTHYLIASWIGMMPGTVIYVWLGSLARAGARAGERTPAQWTLSGLGLAATIAVTILITRIARKAMARRGAS
jgi:uncharacterized membrane protein YdjX (TVP38/TMEM64 family)